MSHLRAQIAEAKLRGDHQKAAALQRIEDAEMEKKQRKKHQLALRLQKMAQERYRRIESGRKT